MAPRTPAQFEEIRSERKAAILNAALHVFAEESYHRASVAKIAGRAGVSKGLIYNYFKNKEELLHHLMEDVVEEMMQRLALPEDETFTPEEFRHFIEVSFQTVTKDPAFWKLYFAIFLQPDVLPIVMESLMKHAYPVMIRLTNYFASKGHAEPEVFMRYFAAVMDGMQFHAMMDPENFPVEKVKELLIAQFS